MEHSVIKQMLDEEHITLEQYVAGREYQLATWLVNKVRDVPKGKADDATDVVKRHTTIKAAKRAVVEAEGMVKHKLGPRGLKAIHRLCGANEPVMEFPGLQHTIRALNILIDVKAANTQRGRG